VEIVNGAIFIAPKTKNSKSVSNQPIIKINHCRDIYTIINIACRRGSQGRKPSQRGWRGTTFPCLASKLAEVRSEANEIGTLGLQLTVV